MNVKKNFLKGIFEENQLFVALLGLCPALAITTTLENAIGMGMAVFFVLVFANIIVSLIMSNDKLAELVKPVRIPVFIVVIATLVTIVEMVMHAFLIDLYNSLGVFIPLIVVNCMILGRAEAFAAKNKPFDSMIDGAGMALGYALGIMVLGSFREVLGQGTLTVWGSVQVDFGFVFDFLGIQPLELFTSPVGAFMVLGFILAAVVAVAQHRNNKQAASKDVK